MWKHVVLLGRLETPVMPGLLALEGSEVRRGHVVHVESGDCPARQETLAQAGIYQDQRDRRVRPG